MSEHVWVAHMREKYVKTYLGTHEGKQLFGRCKNWWEVNIKMDLGKRECEGVDWHPQACDRNQWCALCKHSTEASGSFKLR